MLLLDVENLPEGASPSGRQEMFNFVLVVSQVLHRVRSPSYHSPLDHSVRSAVSNNAHNVINGSRGMILPRLYDLVWRVSKLTGTLSAANSATCPQAYIVVALR